MVPEGVAVLASHFLLRLWLPRLKMGKLPSAGGRPAGWGWLPAPTGVRSLSTPSGGSPPGCWTVTMSGGFLTLAWKGPSEATGFKRGAQRPRFGNLRSPYSENSVSLSCAVVASRMTVRKQVSFSCTLMSPLPALPHAEARFCPAPPRAEARFCPASSEAVASRLRRYFRGGFVCLPFSRSKEIGPQCSSKRLFFLKLTWSCVTGEGSCRVDGSIFQTLFSCVWTQSQAFKMCLRLWPKPASALSSEGRTCCLPVSRCS